MSRRSFIQLVDLVADQMAPDPSARTAGVSLEKRVAIGLWTMATTSEMRSIGCIFGVGTSSVHNFFQNVREVSPSCHSDFTQKALCSNLAIDRKLSRLMLVCKLFDYVSPFIALVIVKTSKYCCLVDTTLVYHDIEMFSNGGETVKGTVPL